MKVMLLRFGSIATILVLLILGIPARGLVAQANQGWSAEEIDFYHHATEGTNLAPLSFVLNLPDPTGEFEHFTDRLVPEYGFVPGKQSTLNPHGLPAGFAIDNRPSKFGDRPYLGITCSACHTRQLTYTKLDETKTGNKRRWIIPIHGGPSMIDMPRFKRDLFDAFFEILKDDKLMRQFANGVLSRKPTKDDIRALREEIRQFTGPITATRRIISDLKVKQADFGPGNLNALAQGYYNKEGLTSWLAGNATSPHTIRVPFEGTDNLPPMWFATRDNWAQWFVEIHHAGPRNWIQSVATSQVRPPKMIKKLGPKVLLASIHFENIDRIQMSLERLRTPKWPTKILGELDLKLIDQGKLIYKDNCASCHTRQNEAPNELGIVFRNRVAFDVGTDPVAHNQFSKDAEERVKGLQQVSAAILGMREAELEKRFGAKIAANYMRHYSRGRPNRFGIAKGEDYEASIEHPKSGAAYWASPMEGIFSSSPYFHNGSVPTLADVLEAPSKRPVTFRTGTTEFDPKHVGFKNEGSFVYDTRELGKSNKGHVVGTALQPSEKQALLEYLKSL